MSARHSRDELRGQPASRMDNSSQQGQTNMCTAQLSKRTKPNSKRPIQTSLIRLILPSLILLGSLLASHSTAQAAVSVSLSSPAPNSLAAAPATIVLTATAASTNSTIKSVAFYKGSTLLNTDTTAPYTYTWNNVAAGSYSLTARVVDNKSAKATSTAISIKVINDTPPSVSLSSPAANAVAIAPASFSLSATASSVTSSVAKVDYYSGTTLIGTATVAPYSSTWSNVAAGTYSLTAKATDALGKATTSAAISVTADQVPSVSITSPAAGSQLISGNNLTLTASASNPTSAIAQVDFYLYNPISNSNTLLGSDITAPYSTVWTAMPVGNYSLMAVATDVLGTAGTSNAVPITVNNRIAQAYYIHSDQLDTPRQITNTSGSLVWQWENLFPFGENLANENPSGQGAFNFNLRFPGQYFDGETGLHQNYFRDYDPATGRYVESDPIGLGGGINTYTYVGGNPLSYIDPLGLYCQLSYSKGRLICLPLILPPISIPIATGNNGEGQKCRNNVECTAKKFRGGIPLGCWRWSDGESSKIDGRVLEPCPGTNTNDVENRSDIQSHSCPSPFGPGTKPNKKGHYCSEGCVTGTASDIDNLNNIIDSEPGTMLKVVP